MDQVEWRRGKKREKRTLLEILCTSVVRDASTSCRCVKTTNDKQSDAAPRAIGIAFIVNQHYKAMRLLNFPTRLKKPNMSGI